MPPYMGPGYPGGQYPGYGYVFVFESCIISISVVRFWTLIIINYCCDLLKLFKWSMLWIIWWLKGTEMQLSWGKGFPYSLSSVGPGADPGVQAVSPQESISHPSGSRLPLLSARPAVTFPAAEHHRLLDGNKLYCLVTEAHGCEQLAQGCYAALPNLLITSSMLYSLCHLSVMMCSVLFFSCPRSEGWPHHGRIFSIYLCPVSFWFTFSRESCPRIDVAFPGRVWSSSPACTWHCSLHYLFLQATPLFPHGVTIVC